MKINYIKTMGFRKFENEFESELYDITNITGGNTKGKTNILYAIIWAFLGTNLTGDDKVWLGNQKSENCYIKLKFIDNNGLEHTIERYKNKYSNKKNFILLDDKKIDQEKLVSFYSDKKLFLSIINPSYFINKKPAEQKELIDKYLPEIDISVVYNKLEADDKSYLEGVTKNIVDFISELNSNKKFYDTKILNLQGKIEYAENIANEIVEEKQEFTKQEELSLARQELSFLTNDTITIDKAKQEKIVLNLNNQISQYEQQLGDLTEMMTTDKKKYLNIKNQAVSHCPMCEQEIKEQSRMTTILNMKASLEQAFEKRKILEQELLNVKSQMVIERCKLHSFEEKSDSDTAKQIVSVEAQIQTLEQEMQEIERHNNTILLKQKNINGAKQDIQDLKKQISEYEKALDNLKQTKSVAQKLYINYLEEKMKFATKHLKNVKIKYYTILKDGGELKDDFIITYNGNELKNLSRSELIATSLELCNMFNKISNVNIPLFIDDSESCADYDFIQDYSQGTQILIARVEKGQDLKIQNYEMAEDYIQAA